jgi:hypothetical protein
MTYRHNGTRQGALWGCKTTVLERVDQTNPNASITQPVVTCDTHPDASLTETSITMSDVEMDESQGEQKMREIFTILTVSRHGL